jgi:hypothetical protein
VIRGTRYQSYLISYFANRKRQRRRFGDFADASREAKRIATQKAQGAVGGALTAANRVALEQALTMFAGNEGPNKATAPRLIEIVREYADATKNIPAGATLTEAVKFFALRHPSNMARTTVAEVVDELSPTAVVRVILKFMGRQIGIGDVNDDGKQDFIIGNKLGAFVFTHESKEISKEVWEQAQPTVKFPFAGDQRLEAMNVVVDTRRPNGTPAVAKPAAQPVPR